MDEGYVRQDDSEDAEAMHALLGDVITQILKPGEALSLQEIIGALYRTGLRSDSPGVQQACEKVIRLLAKKMN
jgi:hypothetical protein